MVTTGGGGIDVIFCGESTVGLIIVTGGSWDGEGITYGESDRSGIDGDSRSFVIDISDVDGDVGFGVKGWSAVVSGSNF